jgi:hypothetical protein
MRKAQVLAVIGSICLVLALVPALGQLLGLF